jgi:hypothetical protein
MLSFEEHKKPSIEQIEENLNILDLIWYYSILIIIYIYITIRRNKLFKNYKY